MLNVLKHNRKRGMKNTIQLYLSVVIIDDDALIGIKQLWMPTNESTDLIGQGNG